jgi:hypothetical protein
MALLANKFFEHLSKGVVWFRDEKVTRPRKKLVAVCDQPIDEERTNREGPTV